MPKANVMWVCDVCGMVCINESCITCGTVENENLTLGVNEKHTDEKAKNTDLPFDLNTPNRRNSNSPIFGLETSPTYANDEKIIENDEKTSFSYNLPFGFQDAPDETRDSKLIFDLSDSPSENF